MSAITESLLVCQTVIAAGLLIIPIILMPIRADNSNGSPLHLLTSSNFTTYKLPVPGSDPITIIEANNRLSSHPNRNDYQTVNDDNGDDAEATTLHQQQYTTHSKLNKLMDSNSRNHFSNRQHYSQSRPLTSSHHPSDNNQNMHAAIGFNVAEPDAVLDATTTIPLHYERQNETRKQNYSPLLLEKFIKQYSDKYKHADEATRNSLKDLERVYAKDRPKQQVINDRIDNDEEIRLEQKYNHWNEDVRRPNNPFNDRDGWVTLDAVPWSTSKVSKWHPNTHKNPVESQNTFNGYQRPSSSSSANHWDDDVFSRPPSRPGYYNSADDPDDDYNYNDRYTTNKPVYTTYHAHHRPQQYDERPTTHSYQPASSWQQQQQQHHHDLQTSSYDKKPTYVQRPRPYRYDYSQSSSTDSVFNDGIDVDTGAEDQWYDNNRYKPNKPKPFSEDILTEESSHYGGGNYPNRRPIREQNRPLSHPDDGDGEWVLISTTKGYHGPNRGGNRAITMQRFQSAAADTHQTVKLTVYPTTNKTFSYDTTADRRRKPWTLSHNGLLEVSPSFQSVDAAAEASNAVAATITTRRNSTAANGSTTKRKVLKRVPLRAQQSSQDSSAVLAAVGAGMVPATVAMLMPMVLGRKKRELRVTKSEWEPVQKYTVQSVRRQQ